MEQRISRKEVNEDKPLSAEQVTPLCAWCLAEQGIPAGEGSHGICKRHADAFLNQWKGKRNGRSARTVAQ